MKTENILARVNEIMSICGEYDHLIVRRELSNLAAENVFPDATEILYNPKNPLSIMYAKGTIGETVLLPVRTTEKTHEAAELQIT